MGEQVTWRARHFGIWQTLTSRITAYEYPTFFVDEMVEGVFKDFRHEHLFEEQQGQTLMRDIFSYTSPLGLLGKIADVILIKRYMKDLLLQRNLVIKDFAESNGWQKILA